MFCQLKTLRKFQVPKFTNSDLLRKGRGGKQRNWQRHKCYLLIGKQSLRME